MKSQRKEKEIYLSKEQIKTSKGREKRGASELLNEWQAK